jgi:hypothetical protein
MKKILCFFGFHNWEYLRWIVRGESAGNGKKFADRLVNVKRCKRCRAIKRSSILEFIKKTKTITNNTE